MGASNVIVFPPSQHFMSNACRHQSSHEKIHDYIQTMTAWRELKRSFGYVVYSDRPSIVPHVDVNEDDMAYKSVDPFKAS